MATSSLRWHGGALQTAGKKYLIINLSGNEGLLQEYTGPGSGAL